MFCSIWFFSVLFYSLHFYLILFCSIPLYCIVLCSIQFYAALLHCALFYCVLLYYALFYYTVLFKIKIKIYCYILLFSIIFCFTWLYSTLFYYDLFYCIVLCSITVCSTLFYLSLFQSNVQYSALFCHHVMLCVSGGYPGCGSVWAQYPADAECGEAGGASVWCRVGARVCRPPAAARAHVHRLPHGGFRRGRRVEGAQKNRSDLCCLTFWTLVPDVFSSHIPISSSALIGQFVSDVAWGELDVLLVDTPPGTSDEHLAVLENLRKHKVDGAVLVTTPQVNITML